MIQSSLHKPLAHGGNGHILRTKIRGLVSLLVLTSILLAVSIACARPDSNISDAPNPVRADERSAFNPIARPTSSFTLKTLERFVDDYTPAEASLPASTPSAAPVALAPTQTPAPISTATPEPQPSPTPTEAAAMLPMTTPSPASTPTPTQTPASTPSPTQAPPSPLPSRPAQYLHQPLLRNL
jgi:hypothetical protein